jgi:hypothetical protein
MFMTRTATGLCLAAAFGFVASLGAQTTGTTDQSQRSHESMSRSSDEMMITGCLEKGADGNYILTNAHMDNTPSASSGATSTGTTGTTSSATPPPSTTGSTMSEGTASGTTWQLSGGKDLDKHVGHKIQVTGREASSSSRKDDSASSGSTTGTTAGTTATTATTGTTAGTSGTTAGSMTGTTGETQEHAGSSMTAAHKLDVKSVKMISTSCS